MKRIVQCPKCETKLSVFDLGKPITQKCPKCGNTFDVASENAADAPAAETPPEASSVPAAEKPLKSASASAAPKPSASAASAEPMPVVAESGISFLQVLLIFVLLLLILGVQVFTFKKTQTRLTNLETQISTLSSQVKKIAQP